MIVCICRNVSDREIREWSDLGGEGFDQMQADTGVGTCYGRCRDCAQAVLESHELIRRANVATPV